jgi:hypothetical protein
LTDGVGTYLAVEHVTLRTGGGQGFGIDSTWNTGGWFDFTITAYHVELLTVEHAVNSLSFGVALRSSPAGPRSISYRGELRAGFRVLQARAEHGAYRKSSTYGGLFSFAPESAYYGEEALSDWDLRQQLDQQRAWGVSAEFLVRMYLHVGRHVSLILPDLAFSLPLAKPGFDAVERGDLT